MNVDDTVGAFVVAYDLVAKVPGFVSCFCAVSRSEALNYIEKMADCASITEETGELTYRTRCRIYCRRRDD